MSVCSSTVCMYDCVQQQHAYVTVDPAGGHATVSHLVSGAAGRCC